VPRTPLLHVLQPCPRHRRRGLRHALAPRSSGLEALTLAPDLRQRIDSVVPGEAPHAQRPLTVVVGIAGLTCTNALTSVGRGRSPLVLLPRICHAPTVTLVPQMRCANQTAASDAVGRTSTSGSPPRAISYSDSQSQRVRAFTTSPVTRSFSSRPFDVAVDPDLPMVVHRGVPLPSPVTAHHHPPMSPRWAIHISSTLTGPGLVATSGAAVPSASARRRCTTVTGRTSRSAFVVRRRSARSGCSMRTTLTVCPSGPSSCTRPCRGSRSTHRPLRCRLGCPRKTTHGSGACSSALMDTWPTGVRTPTFQTSWPCWTAGSPLDAIHDVGCSIPCRAANAGERGYTAPRSR
jgi:hypothetical protein